MSNRKSIADEKKPAPKGKRHEMTTRTALAILLVVTLAMFFHVLFTPQELIPTAYWSDMLRQFVPWRSFGFQQLREGNLPLWNPHVFCGNPFVGSFQTAMFYPLNLLYLFLPLAKAISVSIALHTFLAGMFMYLWTRHRKIHPAACLISSILLMFCADQFMHVRAGHLANQASMIWAPLVLLAIDGYIDTRSFRWCLLGIFAVGMQILAGHPQYVFYTAVTAVIYTCLCLMRSTGRLKIGLVLVAIYIGAVGLSAVQLATGSEVSAEAVRAGGLPYHHAAGSSFPPENLILMLAPSFFGNLENVPYWGRHYLWEVIPFLSVTGLLLAGYGLVRGDRKVRRYSGIMAGILLLLALGGYTPLFKLLYSVVPGFDRFRCNARFLFFLTMFILMLSAIGLDQLIRSPLLNRRWVFGTLAMSVLIGGFAICLAIAPPSKPSEGLWSGIMQAMAKTTDAATAQRLGTSPEFLAQSAAQASRSLAIAAVTCLLLAGLFLATKYSPTFAYFVGILAVTEILVFAGTWRSHFDLRQARQPALEAFFAEHPEDVRIYEPYQLARTNYAVYSGRQDIWGYDPVVLKRYAEFIGHTQGKSMEDIAEFFLPNRMHPLYRMLRCGYFLAIAQDNTQPYPIREPLPRALLVRDYQVIPDRDSIFAAMDKTSFDPGKTVILESQPNPRPIPADQLGSVRVVNSSTDHLTIEADVPQASILLVTDAYSEGWHARALPGSCQREYTVMPANYVLRAVPLSAGHHIFRMEYAPRGFVVGKWVSIISLVGFLGLTGWAFRRSHNGRSTEGKTGGQVAAA